MLGTGLWQRQPSTHAETNAHFGLAQCHAAMAVSGMSDYSLQIPAYPQYRGHPQTSHQTTYSEINYCIRNVRVWQPCRQQTTAAALMTVDRRTVGCR